MMTIAIMSGRSSADFNFSTFVFEFSMFYDDQLHLLTKNYMSVCWVFVSLALEFSLVLGFPVLYQELCAITQSPSLVVMAFLASHFLTHFMKLKFPEFSQELACSCWSVSLPQLFPLNSGYSHSVVYVS
jgi:hypothetical protein